MGISFEAGNMEVERMPDGSVRIIQVIAVVSPQQWASVAAAMSYRGENPETTAEAERFHQGEVAVAPPVDDGG